MLKCSPTTHILVMFLVLTLLLEQTRKVSLFGVFVGFNQFRETVVFGVVLRYDETYESFKWLFETFLKALNGKQPKAIYTITHQDSAMGKAVNEVFLEAWHGLCTFHIMQNAAKHLAEKNTILLPNRQPKTTRKNQVFSQILVHVCLSTKMRKHFNKHLTP